jgi:hypothetical protein
MKRSEMVNLIAGEAPAHEYWGADYDAAERVLKMIEEAGMLPPCWTCEARIPHVGEDCEFTWEPEDEVPT